MSKSRIIDILVRTRRAVIMINGTLNHLDALDKAGQDDVIEKLGKEIQWSEEKGTFKDACDMVIDEGITDEEILKELKELGDLAIRASAKAWKRREISQGYWALLTYLGRTAGSFRCCEKYVSALKTDKPTEDKTLELPKKLNTEEAKETKILRYHMDYRAQAAGLFKALQDAGFLGEKASRNDWLYICGVENTPKASEPIDWQGTQAELTYLIQEVFKNSPNPWKICASAFTVKGWKSHATLTLLAKQDCPLWLQYD